MLLGPLWDSWGCPELDSMILVRPFQLRTFQNSTILTSKAALFSMGD